jgi:plastocyanin
MIAGLTGGVIWNVWQARDNDERPGLVFIIPEGSKNNVLPELESAVQIPTDIRFGPEETAAITIVNEDDVTHRAGPFLVGPGQTYIQRFDDAGSYPIACAVDPAESIVVTVEA